MDHEDKLKAIGINDVPTKDGKKIGMTSEEAAALYLSDGATADPRKAEILTSGEALDFEAMARGRLRESMGFDFEVKYRPRKIHVYSKGSGKRVSAHAKVKPGELDKYNNIVSDDLIRRLVEACVRLKERWDEVNAD